MHKRTDFKLSINENILYRPDGRTLNVPEEILNNYSEEVQDKAKQLQAKNGSKYSDEYYLKYAKSLVLQDLIGGFRRIHKNRANQFDIKDTNWAQYSYAEIIEMSNNGYKVPYDVLRWAQAQQQSDVTDYVIMVEGVETDDSSSTQDISASDHLSSQRVKSLKDIANVEKTMSETEKSVEKYNAISQQAKNIQQKKENSYKDSMQEVEELTNEWKTLNEKSKKDKLSGSEQKRFEQLYRQLNGSNGTLMKELQADNADLDEFLVSLDSLNTKIDSNLDLAKTTIQDATDLSVLEKTYNPLHLPFVNKNFIPVDGNGNNLSTLYGIRVTEIADVAMKKGKDLEEYSNNVLADISNADTQRLANFASDYSNLATQNENNTQNIMGEVFDEKSRDKKLSDNTENNNETEKTQNSSTVQNPFKEDNEILPEEKFLIELEDLQNRASKSSAKDDTKNANKNPLPEAQNIKDTADFDDNNLEQIVPSEPITTQQQTDVNTVILEEDVKPVENISQTDSNEQTPIEEEIIPEPEDAVSAALKTSVQTQKVEEKQSEIENLSQKVESESVKSTKIVKDTEISLNETEIKQIEFSTNAQILSEQILSSQNQILNAQNPQDIINPKTQIETLGTQFEVLSAEGAKLTTITNRTISSGMNQINTLGRYAQDLGSDILKFNSDIVDLAANSLKTMTIGLETIVVGGLDIAKGTTLIAVGTPLLSNPFTASKGASLISEGKDSISQGTQETLDGGTATIEAFLGTAVETVARSVSLISNTTAKSVKLQYTTASRTISDSINTLQDLNPDITKPDFNTNDSKQQNNVEEEKDENNVVTDEAAMSASASTNANINDLNMTDDKADRKLTRFNNESIIESKKKNKKVVAVSSSARSGK